jgi:Ca-activated chloride channel family protein
MSTWLEALFGNGGAQFHFLRPWWLLGLLAAALLLWVVARREDVRRRWRGTIAPHLLDALVVEPAQARRIRPVHLTALAIALGAVALAGPSWERERPPFVEEKAPLAIAIDLSRTMDAVDVSPTRLERAKLKVKALLALRAGARTAVYAYAGSTHLVLPLTDDAKLIQTFVDSLQTRIMPVPGRNTALALRTIDADLSKEEAAGTILFLTDGVEADAVPAFKAQVDSGRSQPVVLAIGTARGGPVRSGDGFAQDAQGRQLFARLDVDALKRLKRDADVPVATVTIDGDDDVAWVQRRVQSHLEQKQSQADARWKDEGWWLTIPIALLAAMWFRKGWTVRWVAALLVAVAVTAPQQQVLAQTLVASQAASPSQDADAAGQDKGSWRFVDWWLTRDQQGRLAFQRGDYVRAAALFEDPMWRGVAFYRAGRYAEAVDAFARVDSAESDFNQGNALAHQKRYDAAAARYTQALERRPGWPEATANLALVKQLMAQAKKDDGEGEEGPNVKPDKIQFDEKGEKGKKGQQPMPLAAQQTADTWMRNIQTTPTDLLARKFAIQADQSKAATGAKP